MGSISVSNLGKAYKQYSSRWMRLLEWILPGAQNIHQNRWVLKDISFTVNPGEALGIVGINGAGKSTLLKLITGTTQATVGSVLITGRVSALLELGMGFHPDFTGRQNVLMAAQLLGINAQEIDKLMPEIESFAEIGDYINQPVRVYSSGMQVRLAFAVATAIRPDVLIVDEALSVGDAYFQHKSFARIRSFRELGTTLLLVSHDKTAIQAICDRAILLDGGRIFKEGSPEAIFDVYNALLADREGITLRESVDGRGRRVCESGSGEVELIHAQLQNDSGAALDIVEVGQRVQISIKVQVKEPVGDLVIGYVIKDRLGQSVYGSNSRCHNQGIDDLCADKCVEVVFEFFANIGVGTYSISIAAHAGKTHLEKNYFWVDQFLVFNVVNIGKPEFVGVAWLQQNVRVLS